MSTWADGADSSDDGDVWRHAFSGYDWRLHACEFCRKWSRDYFTVLEEDPVDAPRTRKIVCYECLFIEFPHIKVD